MIRYSKGFTRVLAAAAALYVRSGKQTEFLFETSTQQTRLQKAIRQRVDLLHKTERKTVEATVFAVLSGYKQVRVKTMDGFQYAISETTPGVDWNSLHEGQRIECTMTKSLMPRVVLVRQLPPKPKR